MAETNEELEMCHGLENVNCTNDTPNEPKTTNEIFPSMESKLPDQPNLPIESSTTMD